jgi:hypothetical protein
MTAREKLNRQMRWTGIAVYVGITLFVGGALLAQSEKVFAILLCPSGFVIYCIGFLIQRFGLRCPYCRGKINLNAIYPSLWLSEKLRFCPLCGHSLDEELPPPAPPVHRDPHYWHR